MTSTNTGERHSRSRRLAFIAFEVLIIVPTALALGLMLARQSSSPVVELLVWALLVGAVELLPVPMWRGVQMSMAFPLLLAVAFQYTPPEAAAVALLGSFDLRELRGGVSPLMALFNRSQVAVSVLAASFAFHAMASVDSRVPNVAGAALVASSVDYVVNMSLVSAGGYLLYGLSPVEMVRKLRIGRPSEFLVSYLGLGLLGVVLALLFDAVGFWAIATFIAPLVLARQMFFRSRALEEAHAELKEREQVMRALSNRMAEERQDERSHIAAYLHDDLAQLLFRLSLQVDIAKRHLEMGDQPSVEEDLDAIRETKNRTSEKIRALIRDLHRSPLGRAGLPEAVQSFIEDVGTGTGVRFHLDIEDLPLPPPIQLLAYHIAREAVMNSLRHAEPKNVGVSFRSDGETIDLAVTDDGVGFDTTSSPPEDHFGMAMMRERALVAGGSFEITSEPGRGTEVTVKFPNSWLQEGLQAETPDAPSPDGIPLPADELPGPALTPETVRA